MAVKTTQSVKYFLCKHKGMISTPKTQGKKGLGVLEDTCYPRAGRQRQIEPWGSLTRQLKLLGQLQAIELSCLER